MVRHPVCPFRSGCEPDNTRVRFAFSSNANIFCAAGLVHTPAFRRGFLLFDGSAQKVLFKEHLSLKVSCFRIVGADWRPRYSDFSYTLSIAASGFKPRFNPKV